ncbi:MAG: hypothetical protein AABX33_00530 [Nanoarchaeota archaeon]
MNEAELMQFKDWTDFFESEDTDAWTFLYKSIEDKNDNLVIYSCLLKKEYVKESLKEYSWDFHIDDVYGSENVIPILIRRQFHGIKKEYWELCENIKIFFNLYEDKEHNRFIHIDNNGDEEEVIVISEKEVKIKKLFLKEYLFAKKLVLAQFFDFIRYSDNTIEDLGLKKIDLKKESDKFIYHQFLNNDSQLFKGKKSISIVMGKKIISVTDSFKSKLFSEEKEFEEFFVGLDEDSNKKSFTCDEKHLANYFGANKGNPHYLTPTFFEKKVLDKYYNQPEKYSVSDGYLSCHVLWGLRMDNSHKDYVMVFLGDLGHLSNKEQKHWKQYNTITDGKMSHSCFQRSFMAEFCDPDTADLYFKQKFKVFQEKWYKKYGWHLFLPLNKEDEHYYQTLRIPTKESQKEFDELVQALTKIIIDSINIKELKSGLISEESKEELKTSVKEEFLLKKNDQSIEVFKKHLVQRYNFYFPDMIDFLKNLQNLRSTGSAHRKGDNYEDTKKKFGLNNNFKEVFENILVECIKMINTLASEKYNLS